MLRLTGAERALKRSGDSMISTIRRKLAARKINASGNLSRSLQSIVGGRGGSLFLRIDAADYWATGGGSGSPPGTKAKASLLERWLDSKGLPYSAKRIEAKIFSLGSSRHRKGETNVFEEVYLGEIGANESLAKNLTPALRDDIVKDINTNIEKLFRQR